MRCGLSLAVLAIAAAIVIPNLIEARDGGPGETWAIGSLKTIGTAESLFRESDKENDGNLDYGTLAELGAVGPTGLVDSILASGTKSGWLYEATYGASTSEFIWYATARWRGTEPFKRHWWESGYWPRYFATNHEGVIYYTTSGPFRLNGIDCTVPAGARPVGK
jgi:hypothetical protein